MTKLEGSVRTGKDRNIIEEEVLNLTGCIGQNGMNFNSTQYKVMLLLITKTSVLISEGSQAGLHSS